MKKILLSIVILILSVSCSSAPTVEDMLRPLDKTLPEVVSHSFEGNKVLRVSWSETVEVLEVKVGGVDLPSGYLGKDVTITLPHPLEAGETTRVNLMVKKSGGNTARASFLVSGKNYDLPVLLINEVSIKGTTASPDRIELLVVEGGNLQGIELKDSLYAYTLPYMKVSKGDIIVVHWNVKTTKTSTERSDGKTTWYLNSGSTSTLSGTNGVLVLSENPGGKVMDALVYQDFASSEYSGFGTRKNEEIVDYLLSQEEWEGGGADSSLVTSSRVLVRLPGAVDSNTASDWFVCAARKSTFGEMNTYAPFEEN